MRNKKNIVVFGSIILVIILFIGAYAMMVLENEDNSNKLLQQTEVPELEQQQKEYNSKLEAIDNIPEERERNAPSLYNEKYLDSTGVYDPEFLDKDKQRIVDSIYEQGRINYTQNRHRKVGALPKDTIRQEKVEALNKINPISAEELALQHQLFFASSPQSISTSPSMGIAEIYAEIEGDQVVKTNSRLKMRLLQDLKLGTTTIFKNTLIYGVVSFQPNRTLIKIDNIDHIPVKLNAYDLQDGLEGIYVENSFRGEVTNEIVDDIIQDINIAGVPQVSGIKKVFQRSNRSVKVAVTNNYKLILKTN